MGSYYHPHFQRGKRHLIQHINTAENPMMDIAMPAYHHLGGIANVTDTASLFQQTLPRRKKSDDDGSSSASTSRAKEKYADIQVPNSDSSNNADVRDFPNIMRKISKAKRMEESVKDAKRLKTDSRRAKTTDDRTMMMPYSSDYSTAMSTFVGHDGNTMRGMMMPTAASSSASSTDPSRQQFFSSYGGGGYGSALPGGYDMGSSSSAMMGMMMPSSSSHHQHSGYSSSSAMSNMMPSQQEQHQQYYGGPGNDNMISMSHFPPPSQPYLHNNSAYTNINNNNASGNSNETSAAWHRLALSMINEGSANDESPPTSNHMETMTSELDPLPLSASFGNNPSSTTAATAYQQQQHQNHQASAGNDAVETRWKYPPPPEYRYH